MSDRSFVLALAAALISSCAAVAQPTAEPRSVVAVVEVPTPPGLSRPALDAALRQAVPQYRNVAGLIHKRFTVSVAGGSFGGVYAFESRSAAEAWFNPAWYARVLKTYGRPGVVRYYEVVAEVDGPVAAAR